MQTFAGVSTPAERLENTGLLYRVAFKIPITLETVGVETVATTVSIGFVPEQLPQVSGHMMEM